MRNNDVINCVLVPLSVLYLVLLWKTQETYTLQSGTSKHRRSSPDLTRPLVGDSTNKFGTIDMKLKFDSNPGDNRPPFDSMFDESGNITTAVSSLLHFAIIGFGKCGTTSMASWLDQHENLQVFPREVYDLMLDEPAALVKKIYTMPPGHYQRGYKSPVDLSLPHTMRYFIEYWPKTKLIVGIRHPVHWFESLYNFRIQNLSTKQNHTTFPRPNKLIGRCYRSSYNACTFKGEFGLFLRNLGKTLALHNERDSVTGSYQVTELEKRMYRASGMNTDIQTPVPNPVFVFDLHQLSDDNPSRVTRFRYDLEQFLELNNSNNKASPLPAMPVHHTPGKTWRHHQDYAQVQSTKNNQKINICDTEHIPVRIELMRIARASSVWIRQYLLDDETLRTAGVLVSSPHYLRELIQEWMVDPCFAKGDTSNNTGIDQDDATKTAGAYILQAAR
jgi:hypothetical protein